MMKKMNPFLFKPRWLLILSALMLGTLAPAQDLKDKRSVSRSFPASRETTLELENKYGKIQVLTWDKDSVSVEVEIFLTESSASKMRKLKDDIKIDFTGTKTYIIAKTVIESESGRLASELKSISNTIRGSNKRVEINYLVHVPPQLDVVINNKFGDIYLDDLQGIGGYLPVQWSAESQPVDGQFLHRPELWQRDDQLAGILYHGSVLLRHGAGQGRSARPSQQILQTERGQRECGQDRLPPR
jgi:hypothetical protein